MGYSLPAGAGAGHPGAAAATAAVTSLSSSGPASAEVDKTLARVVAAAARARVAASSQPRGWSWRHPRPHPQQQPKPQAMTSMPRQGHSLSSSSTSTSTTITHNTASSGQLRPSPAPSRRVPAHPRLARPLRTPLRASLLAAAYTCCICTLPLVSLPSPSKPAPFSTSAALTEPHVSTVVDAPSRRSLPHLTALRSKFRSPPSLMTASTAPARAHSGHSHGHGHHHHHDNAFLMSTDKNDPGVRITRIGLLCNLGMAVVKFAGGWAFNSKAMTADAWHSITDLASDILTLATVSWSLSPPSDRFPQGFGKIESLGSLGVSSMLLAGGLYMGWESALSLYAHFGPEAAHGVLEHLGHGHGHGHSHSHSAAALGIPSLHAAWLAAGTILVKEWLYHATMKVARERKSSVLASNAIHHRVDSLTGFVTLAAIIGANAVENAAWLDPVGGLLISVMVVHAGAGNTMEALRELIDQSIDDEIKGSVRRQTHKALDDLTSGAGRDVELRLISGTKSGQNYLLDLELAVPGAWSVAQSKEVEDAVRTQVGGKVRGARRVRVRFTPKEGPVNAKFDDFILGGANQSLEAMESHDHDHEHDHGDNGDEKGHGHGKSQGHEHKH